MSQVEAYARVKPQPTTEPSRRLHALIVGSHLSGKSRTHYIAKSGGCFGLRRLTPFPMSLTVAGVLIFSSASENTQSFAFASNAMPSGYDGFLDSGESYMSISFVFSRIKFHLLHLAI